MNRTPTTRRRNCLYAIIGILLCGPLGCQPVASPPAPSNTIEVIAANPVVKQIVEWDEYTARFEAIEFVNIRARVGGYLQSIHFTEGDLVQQGDLLFVIDPRPFEAIVKQAEAAVRQAKAQEVEAKSALVRTQSQRRVAESQHVLDQQSYRRAESLLSTKAIAQEDFDIRVAALEKAKADVESADADIATAEAAIVAAAAAVGTAEAALDSAKLDLYYTQIRAPVGGRISRREVTEGNLVSGGTADSTLLTTIVSLDPIHCTFDADEAAFLKYARLAEAGSRASSREVKNPVYVALSDEVPKYPHQGHMDFVDNRFDSNTGTMRGRAILRNPELILTPGLFARLRLPGSGTYEAVLIPNSAISTDQAEKFVYVVGDDGSIQRQNIKVGPIVHGLRVVRDGLKGPEKIVTRGLQRIRPDVKATVKMEPIKVEEGDGLPDSYLPVPENEWISRNSAQMKRDGGAPSKAPTAASAGPANASPADAKPAATPASASNPAKEETP
jgi:RND family efflux transporter MFP subunit